ncbi:MAG: alpha/beta hydrolase [Candidatus Saccharimonas sp.]
MTQILFIHGGDSFSDYESYLDNLKSQSLDYERLKYHRHYRTWIAEQLPDDDVLVPNFPNGYNAQFAEWVIYFEKIVPLLNDGAVLVGHSLGAMFLAKYLHDNILPFTASKIILIAGRHGKDDRDDHSGSFVAKSATGLERSCQEVHLFHSEDDPVVPYVSLGLFKQDMPSAIIHSFKDQKHFNNPTFPDLLELLKQK